MLCFSGEIYRDMERPIEAVVALERGIKLHEAASDRQDKIPSLSKRLSMSSMVTTASWAHERTAVMLILAEE